MVDKGFADRLALAMRDKRITQGALAAALEVSQSTVSRWLAGSVPRKVVTVGIADFLNVHLDWLREGKGEVRFFSALSAADEIPPKEFFAEPQSDAAKKEMWETLFENKERGFGLRIHLLRRRLKMSLAEFSKRCQMTTSYVSRIESGSRSNPSEKTINKIMDAFPVTREWLLFGDPPILGDAAQCKGKTAEIVMALMMMEQEAMARGREFVHAAMERLSNNWSVSNADLLKRIESMAAGAVKDKQVREQRDFLIKLLTTRFSNEGEKTE